MISLIWAMGRNRVIGKENSLPWHIPADLAYFKKITMGNTVIMGRKTFESMGRPLSGRRNVIITRNRDYYAEGCIVCHSIEDALEFGKSGEAFVAGGVEVYKIFLPYADMLYITSIEEAFEGDKYFPPVDFSKWRIVSRTAGDKDKNNPYTYRFIVYTRKYIKLPA